MKLSEGSCRQAWPEDFGEDSASGDVERAWSAGPRAFEDMQIDHGGLYAGGIGVSVQKLTGIS
jgi:hypothetical protein